MLDWLKLMMFEKTSLSVPGRGLTNLIDDKLGGGYNPPPIREWSLANEDSPEIITLDLRFGIFQFYAQPQLASHQYKVQRLSGDQSDRDIPRCISA
jgi:hypothetical protein